MCSQAGVQGSKPAGTRIMVPWCHRQRRITWGTGMQAMQPWPHQNDVSQAAHGAHALQQRLPLQQPLRGKPQQHLSMQHRSTHASSSWTRRFECCTTLVHQKLQARMHGTQWVCCAAAEKGRQHHQGPARRPAANIMLHHHMSHCMINQHI